jgi:hypothetical protein
VSPTVLQSGPYRLFFFSSDRGEPVHVHVARERKAAKFWLQPVRLEYNRGLAAKDLNKWRHSFGNTRPNWCRRGMTTSSLATETAAAKNVRVTADSLFVELTDGRTVSVPLKWYPRLAEGSPRERRRWELIGSGIGIHWPDLDEDISVDALLNGLASNETATSLRRWRASRRANGSRATRATARKRAVSHP